MRKLSLSFCCMWILISVPWVSCALPMPDAPKPDKRVTLTTVRRDYLLGEPVLLELTFRNLSKVNMKVEENLVGPLRYDAPLWIARDGARFQEFSPNGAPDAKGGRRPIVLAPGGSLTYTYRVVVALSPEFQLALAKPGNYRVYAVYPYQVKIASNIVEVRIKEPAGEDAKVWQKLNERSLLTLLQTDTAYQQSNEVPLKMADLLGKYPTSGYAPGMRHTLSKVYFHQRKVIALPEQDQMKIGSVLGINTVRSFNDKRLGVRRKDFPTETGATLLEKRPVDQVLKVLSEASGVVLDAPKEIKSSTAECSVVLVGECMQSISDQLEASWERRGDGYFLVPFDANKQVKPRP